MHIEFANYLRILADKVVGQQLLDVCAREAADEILTSAYATARVEECPANIDGVVVSDLAFVLSKLMSRSKNELQIMPAAIAQTIAQAGSHLSADADMLFRLEVGGLGYLNGTPTDFFVNEFIGQLFSLGPNLLFTSAALVGEDMREKLEERTYVLPVDWSAAIERSRSLLGIDFDQFEQFLSNKGKTTAEDMLMILALLSDSELDMSPYLLGLSGSQNVPRYFSRFSRDWRSYCNLCQEIIAKGERTTLRWLPREKRQADYCRAFSSVEAALVEGVRSALRFRKSLFTAIGKEQPELLIGHLLGVVHCFYSYYNHPDSRCPSTLGDDATTNLGILSKVLGQVVEYGLKSIEFPCEKSGFVLNLELVS
jgi:hypothetical protein